MPDILNIVNIFKKRPGDILVWYTLKDELKCPCSWISQVQRKLMELFLRKLYLLLHPVLPLFLYHLILVMLLFTAYKMLELCSLQISSFSKTTDPYTHTFVRCKLPNLIFVNKPQNVKCHYEKLKRQPVPFHLLRFKSNQKDRSPRRDGTVLTGVFF